MSKKSHSPKIYKWGTAFLFAAHCLALPRVQSSHGLNILVTWMPRFLVVAWLIVSDGWPNWMWRSLIFLLVRVVAVTALSALALHRTLAHVAQPSQVLIQQWRMISPVGVLATMLFWWSLAILFPCESLQVRQTGLHLPWVKLHRP